MVILADIDAVHEAALLADSLLVEGFGRRGEEDGRVVPENASQNLQKRELEEELVWWREEEEEAIP